MSNPKSWLAQSAFVNATVDEAGVPHLILHATGGKQDWKGRTLGKAGKEVFLNAAEKGLITITPSHYSPIELGKSAKAWEDENGEVFVDCIMDAADHQAMKVHKGVMDGTFHGEVSTGGHALLTPRSTDYIPLVNGINSDDPKHQLHIALIMPNTAGYPEAGAVKAFLNEATGVDWDALTPEQETAIAEGFKNGGETWDTRSAVYGISSLLDALSQFEGLSYGEARENHPEAVPQLRDLADAIQKTKAAAASALSFAASEILEEDEDVQSMEMPDTQGAFMLSKATAPEGAVTYVVNRKFTKDARDAAAKSGDALPDGSFPIKDKADLKNAVKAYGRASDKDAAKKHIMKRAKALGATDALPDDWKASKTENSAGEPLTPEAVKAMVSAAVTEAVSAFANAKPDDVAAFSNEVTTLREQVTTFQNQITALENSNAELTQAAARATEQLSAWEPIIAVLSQKEVPSGAILKPQAFTKEGDGQPASLQNQKGTAAPANSVEAIQQAQRNAAFVQVR